MNELINSNAIKMTSIEIAELVGSQHGNVRISIERLAKRGVIQLPSMQKVENKQTISPNKFTSVYIFEGEQGKRDSIIVVAQLSPEFTARLVDRWRELEGATAKIPQTFSEALRLAADLEDQKAELEKQLALAAPKVEFADRSWRGQRNFDWKLCKGCWYWSKQTGLRGCAITKSLLLQVARRNVPMQEYMDARLFHSERNSGQYKSRNTDIVHHKNHRAWSTVADKKAAR